MEDQDVPHVLRIMRKACRWLAGMWCVFALVVLAAVITESAKNLEDPYTWFSLLGALAFCIPGYLIWKAPDWLIGKYKTHLAQALDDPTKEVQTKQVVTAQSTFEHVEISDRGSRESFVAEDRAGRVIFDSTQRPLRVVFGGGFLVIGLIIGGLIFSFSDEFGVFEYVFVGGWSMVCLIAIGFVYEVTIHKNLGMVERKAGWFVFVATRRFSLMEFSRVVVESTFYRQRHDMTRGRYRSEDPKFSVNLSGTSELNLRVFSHLTDARHMGEEVAAYLQLPLEERAEMQG